MTVRKEGQDRLANGMAPDGDFKRDSDGGQMYPIIRYGVPRRRQKTRSLTSAADGVKELADLWNRDSRQGGFGLRGGRE
jgi:hypothetical protein